MELDEPAPTIDLAMERPLFAPPFKPRFAQEVVADGDQAVPAGDDDFCGGAGGVWPFSTPLHHDFKKSVLSQDQSLLWS
jgi:hypothetical protein